MTLAEYLRETSRKQDDFAREIAVSQAAVTRYVNGLRIPHRDVMARIVAATDGRVSASDFYPASVLDHPNPFSGPAASDASNLAPEPVACPRTLFPKTGNSFPRPE